MKKNVVFMILAVLMMGISVNGYCDKKEKKPKKEKEKKEFKWQLPEKMTGNTDFDSYLLTVDTLYNRVNSYSDKINFYRVQTDSVKEGDKYYRCTVIRDSAGNKVKVADAILMFTSVITTMTKLTADCMGIASGSLSAATAVITKNPLLAFSHGKYLKAGPQVIAMTGKEAAEIAKQATEQCDLLMSRRKSSVNDTYEGALPKDDIIIESVDAFNDATDVADSEIFQ